MTRAVVVDLVLCSPLLQEAVVVVNKLVGAVVLLTDHLLEELASLVGLIP